ncbi:hypothetical protein EXE30_05770 [Acinetobacter halotolerans]|uniref:Uncharacterized protein n=1 Tax=Acinetobacter halotolerans TaxID=1752076 RepID=A0A4Q6XKD3_9GAMM|nr:hypothetical protein [Acinetobacter halotolerans]RZF54730.1 hypothetical protein EXE30_05770 [Acinetobacter halotolerans]
MLSIISKHKVLQSRLGFKLDQFYNILVSLILLSIFLLAYSALQRPINTFQYQQIIRLSEQASHPRTQNMAENVLQQHQVRRVEYLKLLNAYQFESNRIRQYPAMAKEDE